MSNDIRRASAEGMAADAADQAAATYVFGIYGFEFTQAMVVRGVRIVPLYAYKEARELATDREKFNLTGYGIVSVVNTPAELRSGERTARLLADGMTFCQQQHVMITRLIRISRGDSIEELLRRGGLTQSLNVMQRRESGGPALQSDTWAKSSRSDFLSLFVDRFRAATEWDPLRNAFYRSIEIQRLFSPLIELEHFLAFTGLEILARHLGPYPDHDNVAVPISKLLQQHDFKVTQILVETWATSRNAAFHQGKIVLPDEVRKRKRAVEVYTKGEPQSPILDAETRGSVADQLYPLSTLLHDLCLKLLPFDDGQINWNRWRDRQGFGGRKALDLTPTA